MTGKVTRHSGAIILSTEQWNGDRRSTGSHLVVLFYQAAETMKGFDIGFRRGGQFLPL